MTDRQRWLAALASSLILGLLVGIPYYGLPYFYDYFEHPPSQDGYGWSRAAIVLGLPIGTLVTLAVGPLFARRTPPRAAVLGGSAVCALAIAGFGRMNGSLAVYYGLWILYMVGWTFAGPMTHQVLLARIFDRNRGSGLALSFFGVSFFGSGSVALVARPLTAALGYHDALVVMGSCLLLAIPIAWIGLPSLPAVAPSPAGHPGTPPPPVRRTRVFWLLMTGSTFTAAGIAGIIQHLKLILREKGFTDQAQLDEIFGWTVMLMLACSALGRFLFAWGADRFPKRHIITLAFLCMIIAMPLLATLDPTRTPYLFAILFGLGMSSDSLLVAMLAAEHFGTAGMARAMAVLIPVNTVGQTWFPYAVSLLWEVTGDYSVSLIVITVLILSGRILIALVPDAPEAHVESL
jgi:MFS family permease